jgi:signal transduction histidine kinase/CheY-like chemotaxis protein
MFSEFKDRYVGGRLQCILIDAEGIVLQSDQTLFPVKTGQSITGVHPFFETIEFTGQIPPQDMRIPCVHFQWDTRHMISDIDFQEHPDGLLVFVHDLTEHYEEYQKVAQLRNESIVKAERAAIKNLEFEEREKFKNAFIQNFSHELRNPLTSIIAITEVLGNTELSDEQKIILEFLRDSNFHLKSLLEDILSLSLISTGRLKLENKVFNLSRMLQLLAFTFDTKAKKKGLNFELIVDPELPELVEGDRTRLYQVLSNLLENALKYTETGKFALEVQCHQKRAHRVSMSFRVSDTGPGISEEYIPLIFESFKRLNATESGTGLGLSIVSGLLKMMGSQIKVDSKPDKGSIFSFDMALKYPGELKSKILPVQGAGSERTTKGAAAKMYRLLYVEDDERLQLAVFKWLLEFGEFHIDLLDDGSLVIDQLMSQHYDLLLLDVHLPNVSGDHLTRLIRELPLGNLSKIPIIGLTAFAYKEDIERLLKAGMNTVLPKPFDQKILYDTIKQLVKLSARSVK